MSYNGWKNYETWNVALWIGNETGLYEEVTAIASRRGDTREAEQEVRCFIEELKPDLGASMFSDLLTAALGEVDWREIVKAHIEEDESIEEEEVNGEG